MKRLAAALEILVEAALPHRNIFFPMLRLDPRDDANGARATELAPLVGLVRRPEADPETRIAVVPPLALPPELWRGGPISFVEDADGVGRRYLLRSVIGGWELPSLAARVALDLGPAARRRQEREEGDHRRRPGGGDRDRPRHGGAAARRRAAGCRRGAAALREPRRALARVPERAPGPAVALRRAGSAAAQCLRHARRPHLRLARAARAHDERSRARGRARARDRARAAQAPPEGDAEERAARARQRCDRHLCARQRGRAAAREAAFRRHRAVRARPGQGRRARGRPPRRGDRGARRLRRLRPARGAADAAGDESRGLGPRAHVQDAPGARRAAGCAAEDAAHARCLGRAAAARRAFPRRRFRALTRRASREEIPADRNLARLRPRPRAGLRLVHRWWRRQRQGRFREQRPRRLGHGHAHLRRRRLRHALLRRLSPVAQPRGRGRPRLPRQLQLRERRNDGNGSLPFCPDSWWWYNDCVSQSTSPYWGIGAQFDVSPRWGLRLDYDNYDEVGEEFETGRADIETVSVNFVWRF